MVVGKCLNEASHIEIYSIDGKLVVDMQLSNINILPNEQVIT